MIVGLHPRLIKPRLWNLHRGLVDPRWRYVWDGMDPSLVWLWDFHGDRIRSLTGRELVYGGPNDVAAVGSRVGPSGVGYGLPTTDDHSGLQFQEVLPDLVDGFTCLLFVERYDAFRDTPTYWDGGLTELGNTGGPFNLGHSAAETVRFNITDGTEQFGRLDVSFDPVVGDSIAMVATVSLGRGSQALYIKRNNEIIMGSRTPGIASFLAWSATAANHRIGGARDSKFEPLGGILQLAAFLPEAYWTESQALMWLRDPFGPFRMARRVVVRAPAGGAFSLAADPGTYTLTGGAADLLKGYSLILDTGAYTVSGAAADLLVGRTLPLAPGAYTLTGQAADLLAARSLGLDAGAYTLSGADAALLFGYSLGLDPGAYVLTGTDAGVLATRLIQLDAGTYLLTGSDADLSNVIARLIGMGVDDRSGVRYLVVDQTGYRLVVDEQSGARYLVQDRTQNL